MAPLPGGKAIRGDIGGINRVYFRKPCVTLDHGTIFYPLVNEPARKTENTVITIVADEVIEFFNRIISVFVDLLLGND